MKKTIVIEEETNGRIKILEEVMKGALSFKFVVTNDIRVFESKKEAQEIIKRHPCGKGLKFITLNNTQIECLDYLKNKGTGYIRFYDFINLK